MRIEEASHRLIDDGAAGKSDARAFTPPRRAETLAERPFFAGWWGHRRSDRFKMGDEFVPIEGAGRFQLSNPPVFQTAALRCVRRAADRPAPCDLVDGERCKCPRTHASLSAARAWTSLTRRAAWRCCAASRWR